ncbi:MAG: D-glycerate dehydrogenase [Planctomycetota bacterium]|nr:D-glycerate dehydrogenase [Planctomycetota bacterium]
MSERTPSANPVSRPRVAFCRSVPPTIDLPGAEVVMGGTRALDRAELLQFVRGASVAVTWVSEKVNAEFLDAAGPSLRAVCNFAVGTDNIDLAECKRRGIAVSNTPGAVTEGTADLAWALILAVARRLNIADRFARSAEYPKVGPLGPDEFLGLDLTGRTLCILGAGRIGYATALRSIGWAMRVTYVARQRHLDFEMAPLGARRVSMEEGLSTADVVSIHTPLTPDTRRLIGPAQLALLKPSAILVNTARGPVVDEAALVDVLTQKKIWGAGLDVFEDEPRVHPGLINLDNCVLSPHIGSASQWSRGMMTRLVCENARAVLAGLEPPNRVV